MAVMGTDTSVNPCPSCGGFPIVVTWKFHGKKYCDGMKDMTKVYYHCECGECVTDWYPLDLINPDGTRHPDPYNRAREAWRSKKWVKTR